MGTECEESTEAEHNCQTDKRLLVSVPEAAGRKAAHHLKLIPLG